MQKLFPLLCLVTTIAACNTNNKEEKTEKKTELNNTLKNLSWLEGNWANTTDTTMLIETWKKSSDSVLSGESYFIVKGDTVFYETISIEKKGADIFYIPKVSGQNNDQPVSFKKMEGQDNELIFENKAHDFPQRIIYRNISPDSLYARVEGDVEGKVKSEEFRFRRQK